MKLLAKTGRSAFGERSGRASNPGAKDQKSDLARHTQPVRSSIHPLPFPPPCGLSVRLASSASVGLLFQTIQKTKKEASGLPVFTGIGMIQKGEGGCGDGPGAGRAHPEAAVMAATVSSLPSVPPNPSAILSIFLVPCLSPALLAPPSLHTSQAPPSAARASRGLSPRSSSDAPPNLRSLRVTEGPEEP